MYILYIYSGAIYIEKIEYWIFFKTKKEKEKVIYVIIVMVKGGTRLLSLGVKIKKKYF
jgi:hypothetical protein